jgi:hypothetical protein
MIGIVVYIIGFFLYLLSFALKKSKKLQDLLAIAGLALLVEGILIVLLLKDPILVSTEIITVIFSLPPISIAMKMLYDTWKNVQNIVKDFEYLKDFCPVFQKNMKNKFRKLVYKAHKK